MRYTCTSHHLLSFRPHYLLILVSVALCFGSSQSIEATTYYVSNCSTIGNDANSGTSATSPWLTIAKVNAFKFKPGDSILFQSGCTWREQLMLPSRGVAGRPITVGHYGSGSLPVISGSEIVTGWIPESQTATNFTTDTSLQAYWSMDQMASSSFIDGTANKNLLSNVGSVTESPNHVQGIYSAAFDSARTMRLSRNDRDLSPGFVGKSGTNNSDITVGGWVYFNVVAPNMGFFLKGSGKSWGLFLGVGADANKMEWQAFLDSNYRLVSSNNVMALGSWYHVVGRIESATHKQQLFINGQLQSKSYSAGDTTLFADTSPLVVGGGLSNGYLNGNADELFVFNRALSDSEIASIYNAGLDGTQGFYNSYYINMSYSPVAIYENAAAMSVAVSKPGMTPGSWWWDSANGRLYLRTKGDVDPATETIEIPRRDTCITDYRDYTIVTGLTCEQATQKGVFATGDYVVIQNMLVQHIRSKNLNNNGQGTGIFWEGSNNTIQNNTVTDANWGIFSSIVNGKTSDSNLVQKNIVYNIAYDGIGFAVAYPHGGILSNTVGQYNVVHDVGIYGMQGGGLECIFAGHKIGDGNIFRNNIVYHNGTRSLNSYPLNVQGGAGKCSFYSNLVYNNFGPCVEFSGGPGSNAFVNNVCYNNGLAGNEGAGFFLDGGPGNANNILENNIIYGGSGKLLLDVTSGELLTNTIDYNIYFGGSAAPFKWSGNSYSLTDYKNITGLDTNSIEADPQFTNPSLNIFTVSPSSPAVNAGIDLGPLYDLGICADSAWPNNVTTVDRNAAGSGWDIGAYVHTCSDSIKH